MKKILLIIGIAFLFSCEKEDIDTVVEAEDVKYAQLKSSTGDIIFTGKVGSEASKVAVVHKFRSYIRISIDDVWVVEQWLEGTREEILDQISEFVYPSVEYGERKINVYTYGSASRNYSRLIPKETEFYLDVNEDLELVPIKLKPADYYLDLTVTFDENVSSVSYGYSNGYHKTSTDILHFTIYETNGDVHNKSYELNPSSGVAYTVKLNFEKGVGSGIDWEDDGDKYIHSADGRWILVEYTSGWAITFDVGAGLFLWMDKDLNLASDSVNFDWGNAFFDTKEEAKQFIEDNWQTIKIQFGL